MKNSDSKGHKGLRKYFTPATLTFAITLIYLAAVVIKADGDVMELVRVGTRISQGDPNGTEGYDGQFVYFIALDPDPSHVGELLDYPSYRYQRILLPILARILSWGSAGIIPWVIPLIGLVSHTLAVSWLSKLFERWGQSRWYALTYGLWIGFLYALRLDLPETLAFSLVLAGIYLNTQKKRSLSWAAFALAIFAKETTILFALAMLLVKIWNKHWRTAAAFAVATLLPYVLFQVWMLNQFRSLGFGFQGEGIDPFELLPFGGIWQIREYSLVLMVGYFVMYLPTVVLPSLWGLWVSLRRWWAFKLDYYGAFLLANSAILLILPFDVLREPIGTFRIANGLVLALLLFAARHKHSRALNYSLSWLLFGLILIWQLFSG